MYQTELSPIRSPNKQKPIISFKLSSPVLKEKPICQNRKIDLNNCKMEQKYAIYNVKKISDKENIFIPKPSETYTSRMVLDSKEFRRDYTSIEKAKNSEMQSKFIDKSPKQQKRDGQKTCQKCFKEEQSYMILNDNLRCCSNCALEQMKNGKQVRGLTSKTTSMYEDPVKEQPPRFRSLTVNIRPPMQQQDSALIERIERNCDELLEMIEKRLGEGKCVKESFSNKRSQLKRHYERLKEGIQQAIRKDLENLRMEEERELREMELRKQENYSNINELKTIKKRMSQTRQLTNTDPYLLPQGKKSQLNYQLRSHLDTIQTIIQKQSKQGQSLEFTINQQLYKPEKYMATVSKDRKILEWEDFSSFNTSEEFGIN